MNDNSNETAQKRLRFSEQDDEPNTDVTPVPASDAQHDSPVGSPSVEGRIFTRHCPACESGMVAPGIRHNAS